MAKRLEEHRCDAAPQIFANYELDVVIKVLTDITMAPDRDQQWIGSKRTSQKIRFIIWTVNEVGTMNTSNTNECCTTT